MPEILPSRIAMAVKEYKITHGGSPLVRAAPIDGHSCQHIYIARELVHRFPPIDEIPPGEIYKRGGVE